MALADKPQKKTYTQEEIARIVRQNELLTKENNYLKKLTSSKRFKFAEKIATGYNNVFPMNTHRRNAIQSVVKSTKKVASSRKRRSVKKQAKKLAAEAANYEKVIVLNSIPWDVKLKQRPHHLAAELHRLGFFVVYLEFDDMIHPFRKIKDGLVTVNNIAYLSELTNRPGLYFLTPNNMPTEYAVIKSIKDQGFQIIYDYLDEFHEDISGDLSAQMYVWDHLKSLKPVLCTATAKRLHDQLVDHLGKNQKIVMASNAVNVEHFDYEKVHPDAPADLKPILRKKHPIIGFYGALAPWIDFDLLNNVAAAHPEWELVLLGIDYNGAAAGLEKAKNIHNLGAKNYQDLPKYAAHFDCAIIPFKQGEIAKATSPVKLFEYMAAGLPTVCTRDLNECKGYEYVYMAKNAQDFEDKLAQAIRDKRSSIARQTLLEQAKKNTWAARAKAIADALETN
ncbi:glycosyltransferase [Candidatus Saccharibacteria bacterium]|nr:glycosyltransferase [Candidatus Saccharibacteria bacterium]